MLSPFSLGLCHHLMAHQYQVVPVFQYMVKSIRLMTVFILMARPRLWTHILKAHIACMTQNFVLRDSVLEPS